MTQPDLFSAPIDPPAPPRVRTKTPTRAERVRDYFLARPNEWIDGRSFETEGGCYAWRSRISDVRRQFGLVIENRQRTVRDERIHMDGIDGVTVTPVSYVVSEYRYVPNAAEG